MTGRRDELACVYDTYLVELDQLLVELRNTEDMCAELGKLGMLTETHGYIGGIRALRREIEDRARELRRHDDVTVLPMSLTTRQARP